MDTMIDAQDKIFNGCPENISKEQNAGGAGTSDLHKEKGSN